MSLLFKENSEMEKFVEFQIHEVGEMIERKLLPFKDSGLLDNTSQQFINGVCQRWDSYLGNR